ncbi:hypothetical protein BKE38_22455 [Pseudoroseomonas deserti]|uniref:Bacteriophage T5 Orf172 DNA-binding domain-containing protein n=2 Tax=Teichococcus deserti TaxID=1817963 RepID=A0A1V2GY12_9PROT|nr:hypothetical protein BKE38_22455 [Pseudoroseomonas deserti]
MSVLEIQAAVDTARAEAARIEAEAQTQAAKSALRIAQTEAEIQTKVREATEAARAAVERAESKAQAQIRALRELDEQIEARKGQIIEMDDAILLQESGLFESKYNLTSTAEYKARLDDIRRKQSAMIRERTAFTAANNWVVNDSAAEGRRMIREYSRLIIRAFNTECEETVDHVKVHNAESSRTRIQRSYEAMNKLGVTMKIRITPAFLELKLEELQLAVEFQLKRQDEKEAQRQLREQAREEAKLQKEIDAALEALAKEERHFRRAQKALEAQLAKATSTSEIEMINAELASIAQNLGEVEAKRQDVDYRAQHASAGYVYIISNIGAFGEDVFKIGVTRRLEPLDRIDELGGASVPFDFDVHALVFSEDAYGLENDLHRHFASQRLNMVNGRKEFFRASLPEIEEVLRKHFAKPVEFNHAAEASAYRQTVLLRQAADAAMKIPA